MYFVVLETMDNFCEDISEDLRSAVLCKTEDKACAESFLEAFREGLAGFYCEYEGRVYNAFQAFVRASEELPEDLYKLCESKLPYIPEVPIVEGKPNYYSNKVLVFDFDADDLETELSLNRYYLKEGFGKCVTVASLIASKVCWPAGEFRTDICEELEFGKKLIRDNYEINYAMTDPRNGAVWAMDQLFVMTDICDREGEPTEMDICRYEKKAAKIVKEDV